MREKKQISLGARWSDLFGEFDSCGYVREKRGINVDVHVMMDSQRVCTDSCSLAQVCIALAGRPIRACPSLRPP